MLQNYYSAKISSRECVVIKDDTTFLGETKIITVVQ
jgi:hypothetical protein